MNEIEKFITVMFGERCNTKDIEDFPEIVDDHSARRCPVCEIWDVYDDYVKQSGME